MFKKINLSAYLEIFKPCGYLLKIKKTQGNSGKFLITQEKFFDSKSGNPGTKNKIKAGVGFLMRYGLNLVKKFCAVHTVLRKLFFRPVVSTSLTLK